MSKGTRCCASFAFILLSLSGHFPLHHKPAEEVKNYGRIRVSQSLERVAIDTGPIQITFSNAFGRCGHVLLDDFEW